MKQTARILNASAYLTRFDAPSPANDAPAPSVTAPIAYEPKPAEPQSNFNTAPDIEALDRLHEQTTLYPPSPPLPEPVDLDRLKAEFETKLETLRADERARAARAMEEARAAWIIDEGERLEKQLAQTLDYGLLEIRNEIARIVAPFIQRKIEKQAHDTLLDDVLKCVESNVRATIEISGAPDMIARISAVIAPFDLAILSTESETPDLCIQCDATKIETAISPIISAILGEEYEDHERK